MRTTGTRLLLTLLLAIAAVGCDDTVEGIQDDAQTIGSEIEEGVDDATDQ